MTDEKKFSVLDLQSLEWPASLKLPTKRFRLLVAAHTIHTPVGNISRFALAALNAGMVYCCAWGQGCERFHDIIDECIVEDDIGPRKFVGVSENDVVMTTWHNNDTLEEALDFFASSAVPTGGFAEGSDFRVVMCIGHPEWAATAQEWLAATKYFI